MKSFLLLLFLLPAGVTAGQPIVSTASNGSMDSEIDIPIQVNLRPIFALAEKNVDTVFTSPNYPNGWVQPDCGTRYKYRFRRSPLQMTMNGTRLQLGFTGYYRITGATRACVKGTVISPWTPSCSCGVEESERRVTIGYTTDFKLQPNHILTSRIQRTEPQALDKCTVCFWGQDVTTTVLSGIKAELDHSRKVMEDSFGTYNLRPYMQQAWQLLSTVYSIPGVGYFSLYPKKLRMQNINAKDNLLNITIGITASPVISFARPAEQTTPLPNLSTSTGNGGFTIFLDGNLQYDSLTRIMNSYLVGQKFQVSDGLFKKQVTVKGANISGTAEGGLMIHVDFTGSFNGVLILTGKPAYNDSLQAIEVKELDYSLQTKNLLLKTAKWLFNKKILDELNTYTRFELKDYYRQATDTLNLWLNREWAKGIKGSGKVSDLRLTKLEAQPQHLFLRSHCTGDLRIQVSELNLKF